MADKTTTTATLIFDSQYVDGDTRRFNLKNPKDEITTSEIEAVETQIRTNNLLIGDKSGATFGKFKKVTRQNKKVTTYDLT